MNCERKVRLRRAIPGEPEARAFRSDSAARFQPPSQEEKPQVPTLGEFAESWLEERRTGLTMATAYDYDRLIKALLMPSPLAQKRIDEVDDGDINRLLGELMKRKGLERPADRTAANQHDDRAIADDLRDRETPQARRGRSDALRTESARAEGEVDPFTLEEAERIIERATGQDRAIVTVLIFCGLTSKRGAGASLARR